MLNAGVISDSTSAGQEFSFYIMFRNKVDRVNEVHLQHAKPKYIWHLFTSVIFLLLENKLMSMQLRRTLRREIDEQFQCILMFHVN